MKDQNKHKAQLINELEEIRQRISMLEASEQRDRQTDHPPEKNGNSDKKNRI